MLPDVHIPPIDRLAQRCPRTRGPGGLPCPALVLCLVLAGLGRTASAASGDAPQAVPAPQPYPTGPLLTLSIPDIPRLRAHLAASWYGALAARALDDAARARLDGFIDQGADLTGIDLRGLLAHLAASTVGVHQEVAFRVDLDGPAAPLLQGVPAALERDRQRADRIIAQDLAAFARMRLGQTDDYQVVQVPERVPAQVDGDGVVLGRTRTYWGAAAQDGVRVVAQGAALLGGGRPVELSPAAVDDVVVTADVASLSASLGIPGAAAFVRASGMGEAHGTLGLESGRSIETLRLPGAHLPLRELDTAVLEAEVPATALALSAIGLDGPALVALAERATAADPLAAAAWGTGAAILAEEDGPAWLAITPGLPQPDVVIAIPAGPALDAWLRATWPDAGEKLDAARAAPVGISPAWPGMPLWIRRSARAWLVATDEHVLVSLGNPGLAARLRTQHGVPAGALAIALQANQAILHRVGALVPLARAAIGLHALSGADLPLPFLDGVGAADAGAILDALAGAAQGPQVPTTLAWLEADAAGTVLHGRDLVVGAGVLPTMALLATAVPQVFPDATVQRHPLVAALLIANLAVNQDEQRLGDYFASRRAEGGMPAILEQVRALATGSPFAAMRGAALAALPAASDRHEARLAQWLRSGLADAQDDAACGAVRGLGAALAAGLGRDGADVAEVLAAFLGALGDPRPRVRIEAAHQARVLCARLRDRKRPVPAALDEAILDRAGSEEDARARAWLLRALPPGRDARVLAAVLRGLGAADAEVRAAALAGAGAVAPGAAPSALVDAVVALRADRAALDDEPYTVGNAARQALGRLRGPDADAALVAELQDAPPPDAGPVFAPCHGTVWRIRAATALLERGHPAGLVAATAVVAEREHASEPDSTNDLDPLATALGASPADGTEALLVRLLAAPDRLVARSAALGLAGRARRRPVAQATIAALTTCVAGPGAWTRVEARRLLDRTTLTDGQRTALAANVAAATATYGPQAFLGYRSPPPPPPQQPVAKPGADDF